MVDWKKLCLDLATVVNREEKGRMLRDMHLGWKMAREILEINKRVEKANEKYIEWWKCEDKKKKDHLYEEYLELIHATRD